ncbi:DUF6531 domain-containing protein [Streptomyces sp. NBC_00335]|uniref:putative T7SS-secreted protein n=1 Tax=unclassified Streptomyces TaxID=2593676 RepID=UPI0022504EEC|nr:MULTISPECIES: DUF6531 domain-containing protein [unclassified Streptomyces]MCX5404122.1 DUF6531 domain-containing protein [Streptomyces sp. NBC_00086]
MGWRDFVPDVIEDGVEKGAEKVGDAVEWAGDKTADFAEDVGLDDAGDWIRDKSRSAANQLGADVAELELGQTEDPNKLVYGSVSKIRAQVSHLNDFKASFDKVGNGLKGMGEPDGLKGKTADSFRESVAKEPPRWFKASEAFGKAADAMGRFAETVEWAQGQAKEALEEYNRAKKVSGEARTAHNKLVDTYNNALKAKQDPLPPRPSENFTDPGTAIATAAQDKLDSARKQRNDVAETVRTAVRAARDAAPPKPSYAKQLGDGMDYLDLAKTHLTGGVIKGTAGIVNFARALNPMDPYNLTHPAEYVTNLNSTAAGLVTMANDPLGAGKKMLDEFMKDPSEGIGKLIPELIGSKGMGALKKVGSAAKHADDLKGPGRTGLDKDGPNQRDKPDCDKQCDGTDPVDLATGRMFLPQTDIVLPGTLPLAFTRRAESGYKGGRWFGPSWSSTVDEHLEIDPEGVVLVTADGLVVAYPHPAPGVPVLATSGPRWSLDRTPEGDYTVTDPALGRIRHFTAPADGEGEGEGDAYGHAVIDFIEDRNGNTITFEYDAEGTPLGIAHSGGHHLRFETADGRITALHLTGGPRVVAYGYTDGHLTEVVNSSGLPLRFGYDERARITSWTDTNDRRYEYAYDERDRCVAEGGAAGHMALTLAYSEADPGTGLRVTTATTGSGHTRRYVVDEAYRVVARTDELGATLRYEYDRQGRLVAETDALGLTTRRTYDARGLLTELVRPDGRRGRMEYDDLGLPVKVVAEDGRVFRQTYDERGNRTSVTSPTGVGRTAEYGDRGQLISLTDALGAVTRVECDSSGLASRVTDPLGAVSRFERDVFGRVVRFTDPLGAVTRMEWTVEGKPARRIAPDGSEQSWTYDGEGNCLSRTDGLGGRTVFEYTDFDLLAARTGPDGLRYAFDYDGELRLTRVTGPQGMSWDYAYDQAGRLRSESDFDGRTVEYGHDAAGRLVSRADGGAEPVTFAYNALGQTVLKRSADGVTEYEYDVFDELAAATTPDGTRLTRLRDRHGRLLSETVDGRTLTYGYDELDRRAARTTPGGAESRWSFDAAGRRSTLVTSGRTVAFDRDAAGREVSRTVGTAATVLHQFDELGRITGQQVAGRDGALLQRRGYTYRADGRLAGIEDALGGARTFERDAGGRITAVRAQDWTERYAYDEAGNQSAASWPDGHPGAEARGERAYEGTRIVRAGAVRYEHDARGRVVLRQKARLSRKPDTWRYTWDADGRLTGVVTPDGTRWRYRHDALGRRTSKQRLADDGRVAEETLFTWDESILCEQTTTLASAASGDPEGEDRSMVVSWDHNGLHPLAQTERIVADATQETVDERFFAIVTDLIGTPRELVGEDGEIAWRVRATLWGATAWNRDATAYTPLRFPGQYYDPETGLHHNYFRTYDPETARYLSPDPLGLGPAPNPATYVNDPLTWTDYLGLAPECKIGEADPASQGGNLPMLADKIAAHGDVKNRGIPGVDDLDVPEYLEDMMTNNPGVKMRSTPSGTPRWAWWDDSTGTMLIREGENGTFMQPDRGYDYYLEQINE